MAQKPQTSAADILASIGDALDKITVFHNQLLVGVYIRSNVTAGGVHLPDSAVDEDKWQGKVGLVLKVGQAAFKNDARNDFGGLSVKQGEWAMFRVSDAPALSINGVHCRLVEDINVRGVVETPEIIW